MFQKLDFIYTYIYINVCIIFRSLGKKKITIWLELLLSSSFGYLKKKT